jgi:hypothetical protein
MALCHVHRLLPYQHVEQADEGGREIPSGSSAQMAGAVGRVPFPGAWQDHRIVMDVRTIVLARSGPRTHVGNNSTAYEFG